MGCGRKQGRNQSDQRGEHGTERKTHAQHEAKSRHAARYTGSASPDKARPRKIRDATYSCPVVNAIESATPTSSVPRWLRTMGTLTR